MQSSDRQFDGWVREHQRLLFGIAYWWTHSRVDAEELTQEAFFQAYRSRRTLRDPDAVKGWLVGILRNCYSQTLRQKRKRSEVSLEEMLAEPANDMHISVDALALHKALDRLEDHYRIPLVLFYFDELSYKEIAIGLDLPIGTVMSRLARARKQLQELMQPPATLTLVKKASNQ